MSKQRLRERFYNMLWTASSERDKFQETLNGVPAWVLRERKVMLHAVNQERSRRALVRVTEDDIQNGELVGHPMYGEKLAEHCARLAVGE